MGTFTLVLLLGLLYACDALRVYQCGEIPTRDPCKLKCCGQSNSPFYPHATFLADGQNILNVQEDFSLPQCRFKNSARTKFECWTSNEQSCFRKGYSCVITQGPESASTSLSVDIPLLGGGDVPVTCLPPTITNFAATRRSDGDVTLTWQYSQTQGKRYCDGSRRFYVAFKSFSTYKNAFEDISYILFRESRYENVGRRKTEYNITGLDFQRFHRFFIRTPNGNGTEGFTDDVQIPVQYFREYVGLSWVSVQQQYHVRQGDPVTISCEATGDPVPTVTYKKLDTEHTTNTLDLPKVSSGDAGLYVCEACHSVFDNERGRFRTDCRSAAINLFVIPYQRERDCVAYTGQQCIEYIHSDWKIFSRNTSFVTEDHISGIDLLDLSNQFSMKCRLFIKSVLCHTFLPYCNPFTVDLGDYEPLPMCTETCQSLETHCGAEIVSFGDGLSEYLWDHCDREEASGMSRAGPGDKPGCIYIYPDHPFKDGPLDSDSLPSERETTKCILDNGWSYRGKQRYTASRLRCQRWSAQWPNRHQFTKLMGGELDTASVYCRNPGGLGERPWCFINSDAQRWEYCDIPDCEQCVPYTGDFCESFGYDGDTDVFFRHNVKDSIADVEIELRGTLHSIQDELTPGCEQVAIQLLCYGTMPLCDHNTKMSLCEEHCALLDLLQLCPVTLHDILYSLDYLDLTACDNHTLPQPPLATPPPSPQHVCLPDPILTSDTEGSGEDLYSDSCHYEANLGHTYTGDVSVTETRTPCIPWSQQHRGLTQTFPELEEAFCRNPGQLRERPWCYISAAGDWEYCDIPLCSDEIEQSRTSTKSGHNSTATYSIVTVCVLILLAVAAMALCIVYCFWKMNKSRPKYTPSVTNPMYTQHSSLLSPEMVAVSKTFRTIVKSKITYVKQLGQGNFGIVFQGEWDSIPKNNEATGQPIKVAVKTLKQECSSEATAAFVREAKLLHTFDHPNIVEFYGVCMDETPFYLVFEFMEHGDLCQFLRQHSSSTQQRYNPPVRRRRISSDDSTISTDSASLGTTDLLDVCKQIAHGMAYLESLNHIHRDLACRNCLVGSGMVVKLSDFGMSHNLYSKDYYRLEGEASLPIRWMPPESIIYGTFSMKGDVWSFGVVVWEVFSFGMQPYWGLPNETVVEMIRRGTLLEKPESCPDKVFSLIKSGCWGMYENERMTFAALDRRLKDFRLSDSDVSTSTDGGSLQDVFIDDITIECDNDKED